MFVGGFAVILKHTAKPAAWFEAQQLYQNPSIDFGWLLKDAATSSLGVVTQFFASSDHAVLNAHPKLQVTYGW